jgi:hypothetical protein
MLQNLFLIRKKFVLVKRIGPIYPQYFSLWKYVISYVERTDYIKKNLARVNAGDTYKRCVRWEILSCCILSFGCIINTLAQILRKWTTIQRNWLSSFAAGCRKVSKTKRRFRESFESCRNGKKCSVPIAVCNKEKHFCLLIVWDCYVDEECDEQEDEDETPFTYHYVWIKQLSQLNGSQLSLKHAKN